MEKSPGATGTVSVWSVCDLGLGSYLLGFRIIVITIKDDQLGKYLTLRARDKGPTLNSVLLHPAGSLLPSLFPPPFH